jgi:hypothetical protein
MGPQSPRDRIPAPPARQRRPARFVRPRCEQFEDRLTPANLFTVQTPINPGGLNNNGFVAVTDLNKDGNADVILTNEGTSFSSSGDKNIVVLYGHGNGTFTKALFSTGAENVSFAAVADINGDGYPDVVTVSENNAGNVSASNPGILSVFKNDGSGNLILMGTQSTSSVNPSWVGLADVTGDGVLDVVVGAFGPDDQTGQSVDGKVTIFQGLADASGHGNFTFTGSPIVTLQPDQTFIPTALAVGDFDGDGNMDIAAAVPQAPADTGEVPPDGLIDIFKGTGAGGFSAQPVAQYDSGGINPVNIQAADVTGDHKADLIISNTGDASSATTAPDGQPLWTQDGVEVLPNTSSPGNPSFGVANSVVLTANLYGPFATAVADFNGDGKPDIAAVNYGGTFLVSSTPTPASVAIFLGNGNGTFSTPIPGSYNVGTKPNNQPVLGGQYLAAGDFDNNGTPDLIVATADNAENFVTSSSAGLMMNNSTPPAPVSVAGVKVNDGSAQRSEVRSITVTFSGAVTFSGSGTVNQNAAAAFQLEHVEDSTELNNLAAAVSTNGSGQTVVTLTFTITGNAAAEVDPFSAQGSFNAVPGPSLADGQFQLTILAANVIGANGRALNGGTNFVSPTDTQGGGTGELQLYRLFGDADGNGVDDQLDLGAFRTANNSVSGPGSAYVAYLDADNNGTIDQIDLGQFRTRNNGSVFDVNVPHVSLPTTASPPTPDPVLTLGPPLQPIGPAMPISLPQALAVPAPAPASVAAVTVNDGNAQRSEVRSITVAFSGPVTFSGGNDNAAAAFNLSHLTDGNDVSLAAAVSADSQGRTIVTLTFSGAETDPLSGENGGAPSLADGRYQLTVLSGAVTGANGLALNGGGLNGNFVSPTDTQGSGPGELGLFRLFGDVNGDGVVDQLDLGQFRAANNSFSGAVAYVAFLDADNSGSIDQLDLGQFRSRLNTSVF